MYKYSLTELLAWLKSFVGYRLSLLINYIFPSDQLIDWVGAPLRLVVDFSLKVVTYAVLYLDLSH